MAKQLARDGIVEQFDGGYQLRFERRINHSVEKVWVALTDPDRLIEWLAEAPEFDLVVGGELELHWQNTDPDGNQAIAVGKITALEAPTTIEYDTDIHGRIRWELEPVGTGCLLRLIVRHDLPNEYLTMAMAGWHIHIDFLEEALGNEAVDWPNWPVDRWEVLKDHYDAAVNVT